MALAHAILATLLEEPRSGYGLAKRFDRSIGYYWQATHQQIYRELAKMEGEGLVQAEVIAQTTRPDKKLYVMTPLGRQQLIQWLLEPTAVGPLREDLLVKVRAGSLVEMPAILIEIKRHRVLHAEKHALYQTIRERDFPDPAHLTRAQQFRYLPLLRGLMFEAENVAWCDAAIALLEAPADAGDSNITVTAGERLHDE